MSEFEKEFTPTIRGVSMERPGPARKRGDTCSQLKLCITATDKSAPIDLMYDLSVREECFYVKYSVEPKDGMYLGRCFLTTSKAIGKVWGSLKSHPKFLITVQDDDFIAEFRKQAIEGP